MWKRRKDTVFISYAHLDKVFASRLANDIRELGRDTWMDQSGIYAGDTIPDEVKKQIRSAHFFVIVVSKHSINSKWVRFELGEAKKRRKHILPILLDEECRDWLREHLPGVAYVDFTNVPYGDAFDKLRRAMDRRRRLPIARMIWVVIILVCLILVSFVLWQYFTLSLEAARIQAVQEEIQHLDDDMKTSRRTIDAIQSEITYYAGDGKQLGKDQFDSTSNNLISRSYYNSFGRRIAIDRFEWQGDLPVKKVRVHYDEHGDEFMRETFSRTGKLEKKEVDKYRNGHFIEREADFVSQFPVVLFPILYR